MIKKNKNFGNLIKLFKAPVKLRLFLVETANDFVFICELQLKEKKYLYKTITLIKYAVTHK
jgi:hypothetical protein